MVLVLLGLCLFFSAMTVRQQQPTPQEAVREVWGGQRAPMQWGTVVVASQSPEDDAFASEFFSAWKAAGVSNPEQRVWQGTPQDIRKRILAQKDQPIEIILAPGARDWVLFEDIENKKELVQLLGAAEQGEGVRIFIGSENRLFSLSGSSIIVSPYRNAEEKIVGVMGILGPTRMNYARIIPMVDYTAKAIGRLLT